MNNNIERSPYSYAELSERLQEEESRLDGHEQICALRWKIADDKWTRIDNSMTHLNSLVLKVAGALILGMGGILVTILFK